MSSVGSKGRSYRKITRRDLIKLAKIAYKDKQDFFNQNPKWAKLFANRVICIALCQGAANHYIDSTTGINDFDVYIFYKKHPQKHWYAKRIKSYDFGDSKFGQSVDKPNFVGRRVDCLGRDIDFSEGEDEVTTLRRYLKEGKTKTAKLLAAKAVVLLEPNCGTVVWPNTSS
ncbi:MAG: hypothetical protein WBW94_17390 [Anaerolineales bacterium]